MLFYILYNIVFTIFVIISSPYYLIIALTKRLGIKERLGFCRIKIPSGVIWIHAASVGEVNAASPLIKEFKARKPEQPILLTVMTKTGRIQAHSISPPPDFVLYLPIDIPVFVLNFLSRINPRALLLMESEMWVNLVRLTKRKTKHIILINGRFSEKTFKRSYPFRRFLKDYFDCFEYFMVREKADYERLRLMGVPALRLEVVGDLKFSADYIGKGFEKFSKPEAVKIIVAGCTREGEEEQILEAFEHISKSISGLRLVLAPRHPERFNRVALLLSEKKIDFARFSASGADFSRSVLLVDAMGKLTSFYAIADIAFIGGSLLNYGGHNPLEPAYFGLPVVSGPYTQNASDAMNELVKEGAGAIVRDAFELEEKLKLYLNDEPLRAYASQKAREVVLRHSKISERYFKKIEEILSK